MKTAAGFNFKKSFKTSEEETQVVICHNLLFKKETIMKQKIICRIQKIKLESDAVCIFSSEVCDFRFQTER